MVMAKSNFITNLTYRVYNKHPTGRFLVYSYRLPYRPTARADHPLGLAAQSEGSGPPVPGWSRPQASTAHHRQWTLPTTLWLIYLTSAGRGRGCPAEVDVADHRRRQVKQANTKVVCLLWANLLGVPPLQSRQVNERIVGAHHADDVHAGEFPGVLDELREPVPRPLRLLDWRQLRHTRLVFRELGADQVKNRGHSFPKLDAIGLLGVPVLDQLV